MRRPHAYLRKSRVFRDKDIISPELQLAQVDALARSYGDEDLVVYTDLNMSGRRRNRPGFSSLLEAIAKGEVSAIYSYSLSRLSRSVRDIVELAELCSGAGVPIRLARDQDPDPTTASGRMMLNFLAAMAQYESDVATERARDTVEARRARGDKLGPVFYAEPDVVVNAYREAGSIQGTARLLTTRGISTKLGRAVWSSNAVRGILARQGIVPPVIGRGVRQRASFPFSRLVRCHCGTFLTGRHDKARGYTSYYCYRARLVPGHGPGSVPATALDAYIRGEANLLDAGEPAALGDEATVEQREALLERRRRLNKALTHGMDESEYDEGIASVEEELTRLELAGQKLVSLDAVVWDRGPDLVNDQLRALWEYVELDRSMRPVRTKWRVPEWRRAREPQPERSAAGLV